MSEHENKQNPEPSESTPNPLGFGTAESTAPTDGDGTHRKQQRGPRPTPLNHPDFERIRLTLDEICSNLQREFNQILSHGRLAKEAVKYFKVRIVPKTPPGRPRKEDITDAVRLLADGEPWRVIYMRLKKCTRGEQDALRSGVRLRKYRSKRKEDGQAGQSIKR
jgi:hypothetical protein